MDAHAPNSDDSAHEEVRIDWTEPTDAELRRLLLGPNNLLNELAAEILRPRKQARLSWALTPEREQEAEIVAAKNFSRDLLLRVATLLRSQAAPLVYMTLGEFKITKKFEIEAKLTAPVTDDALKTLHHRLQRGVTLLALDADDYAQGVAPEADPDQMRMPFGEVAPEDEGETAVEAAARILREQAAAQPKPLGLPHYPEAKPEAAEPEAPKKRGRPKKAASPDLTQTTPGEAFAMGREAWNADPNPDVAPDCPFSLEGSPLRLGWLRGYHFQEGYHASRRHAAKGSDNPYSPLGARGAAWEEGRLEAERTAESSASEGADE